MGHLLMCLGYMGFSVQWHGSKVHPQGWKPTLVTQAFSDSSLWRRGTPTYMGMGDNLSKSKGIITAPPNVFDNIHKDMQLSSEQWHKLPVSWIGQRLFQLVLTNERQSLGTPSFHSLWCRNVWPSARRPGQQKQPRSARSLPLSLSLSLSPASALRISRNKQMGAGNAQPRISCRLAERKESLHSPDILILLHPARGEQRFS